MTWLDDVPAVGKEVLALCQEVLATGNAVPASGNSVLVLWHAVLAVCKASGAGDELGAPRPTMRQFYACAAQVPTCDSCSAYALGAAECSASML